MMAAVVLLLLVSVLDSVKGSDPRFVVHGSDLLLDVNTTAVSNNDFFIWKFNTTVNVVRLFYGSEPTFFDDYNGRTDFFIQNYSLLLRNVQHNDSGNYKAIASGSTDKTEAEYTVKVEDRVSLVNLTLTSIDPSSCNFTATCRTVDFKISRTFQCQSTTCHLLDQTDPKDINLNIYIESSFVTCNHSNHVSWEKDVKNAGSLCKNETVTNTATIVGISAAAAAAAAAAAVLFICLGLRLCKRKGSANTVNEVPQENLPNPYKTPAEVSTSLSPTSTYALVQFANPPVQGNNTSTCPDTLPETIYAQVNRAGKSNRQPATDNR